MLQILATIFILGGDGLVVIHRFQMPGLLRPRDPHPPVQRTGSNDIEDNKNPHHAEVAPHIRVVGRDRAKEHICVAHRAEATTTVRGREFVLDIAPSGGDLCSYALAAGAVHRIDVKVFVWCADDIRVRDVNG